MAVLYILAVASVGIYGIVLAGWSSGSTYPLLGGLRSSAQMISYEVAMGLSFVGVFLYAGSMSTSRDRRGAGRLLVRRAALSPSFVIYCISMVGETNRAPFDLPEAEGELVGGFHTEYSSLKFALFFLAEYINMVTVSALATTLFLGGWRAPWPLSLWDGANQGWWPVLWFVAKVFLLPVLLHLAARHAAPAALRPVHEAGLEDPHPGRRWPGCCWSRRCARVNAEYELDTRAGADLRRRSVGVVFIAADASSGTSSPRGTPDRGARRAARQFDPMAGGHPVPPMPGQQLPGTDHGRRAT